ncbi:hypothetical protein [Candidatus Methylopumilus planktonicus]|uniref:hypothetical protein n=1 Tax=Candidatus Methylopumilus planktonicus TaxID=1581557 RepID=UPI003BEEEC92
MNNNSYYPLYFFQAYLSIILLFYLFGPWNFTNSNTAQTTLYLLTSQVFIGVGYILGVKSQKKLDLNYKSSKFKDLAGIKFIRQGILVNFLLFIPLSLSRTGDIFPNTIFSLFHPGDAYLQNYHRLLNGNSFVFAEYLRSFLSPWAIGILPVLIIYWQSVTKFYKALAVVCIFLNITLYIATGTNKGIADFAVIFPWFFILYKINSKDGLKFNIKYALLFSLIFFMFIIFFVLAMKGRGVSTSDFDLGREIFTPSKSTLLSSLPVSLQVGYLSLVRYLCQGYYALSLCFSLEHTWTFGFGNSMVLARNADIFFDTNFFQINSFPGMLESTYGYSREGLWHSVYPWLASDFGFFGALIVIGFFSFLLALTWCRVIAFKRPFEVTLLYLLIVFFYYIPANNQIFQSLETLICFNICFIVFLYSIFFSKINFFKKRRY